MSDEEMVKFTADEASRIGQTIRTEMQINASETGGKLLRLAMSREQDGFMNTVLARVQELVSHRNSLEIALEKVQKEIALFDRRLAAVGAGEFSLTREGRINYNDILLNL
jgi:hypothetical protein